MGMEDGGSADEYFPIPYSPIFSTFLGQTECLSRGFRY